MKVSEIQLQPKITSFVLVSLLSLAITSGCDMQPQVSNNKVDDTAKAFFEEWQTGNVDALLKYYSSEFFKSIPKEQRQMDIEKLFKQYGPATRYSFRRKQADTRFSGKFYIYIYDTIHGEKRINHILTFLRPVDNTSVVLLVGHKIKD